MSLTKKKLTNDVLIIILCLSVIILSLITYKVEQKIPTLPTHAITSFRFISWADTKSGTSTLSQLSDHAKTLNPAFSIYPGDLVEGFSTGNLDNWIKAVNGQLTNDPVYGTNLNGMFDITFPVRGNHDGARTSEPSQAIAWQNYFNQKGSMSSKVAKIGGSHYSFGQKANLSCAGSLANLDNLSYSFDYGNSHIVGLDALGSAYRLEGLDSACPITADQLNWLDSDLSGAEARGLTHAFIYFHGPVFCVDGHCSCSTGICDKNGVIAKFVSVANKHPIVTATFSGHEHLYTYTYLNSSRDSKITRAFHQFVTGDAGAGSDTANSGRYDYWMNTAGISGGFITVDVDGAKVTITWYKKGSTAPQNTISFTKTSPPVSITPPLSISPTPSGCQKQGDANCDGKVDGFDYVTWWQNFNTAKSGPSFGDFNNSGFVDGFDYVIWWTNFGK